MRNRGSGNNITLWCVALMIGIFVFGSPVKAAQWSTTELQVQYGKLDVPTFVAPRTGSTQNTLIITAQNASGWDWGDSFFFVDFLSAQSNRGSAFNIEDAYGELYLNFSSSKILGINYGDGLLRDVGLIQGFNYGADPNVFKYLPGIRFSWNLPGFAFLNTDFMAYFDLSPGVSSGGAPSETDSWMVDVNWAYPFALGSQKFSIEGHVEYIDGRRNEFGGRVESWVLAQPQVRWDIGNALLGKADKFYVGIEFQYWRNKLGDKATDETAVQALAVWRL